MVRQGDDVWMNVVSWTLFAMVNAKELGVSSKNLEQMQASKNPEIRMPCGAKAAYSTRRRSVEPSPLKCPRSKR